MVIKSELTKPQRAVVNYLRCKCGPPIKSHILRSIEYDGKNPDFIPEVIVPLEDYGLLTRELKNGEEFYNLTKEGYKILWQKS